jgi:hypothetical protein
MLAPSRFCSIEIFNSFIRDDRSPGNDLRSRSVPEVIGNNAINAGSVIGNAGKPRR